MMTANNIYARLLAIATLAVLSYGVFGQTSDVISFVNEDGIYLRWQGQHSENIQGYNVYRQEAGASSWELLNENPLQLITENERIQEIAGYKTGMFLQLFGISDINSDISREAYLELVSDPQAVSFMEVMALVNPKLGYVLGEIYLDEDVEIGKAYSYRINTIVDGEESVLGFSERIQSDEYQSVPRVNDLSGEGLDKLNRMTWKRDRQLLSTGDMVTYRLYRSDDLLGTYEQVNYYGILPVQVKSGTNTSSNESEEYLDKFLSNGQTYFYHVKGVNAFGFESMPGITVQVTTGADLLPDPPINLRAGLMGLNLKLEWDKRKNSGGYEIYRSKDKKRNYESVFKASISPNKPFWIDIGVESGNTYYYYIISTKDKLKSEASDTLVFTFYDDNPPATPMNVIARSDSSGITISWTHNKEKDIKGYEIERAADDDFSSRMLLNTFAIADSFILDKVSNLSQTTYGYVVYAVDSMDNRSLPSSLVKARMPDVVPPQSPVITGLKRTEKNVNLAWSAAVEDDLENYKIFMSEGQNEMEPIGETKESSYDLVLDESGQYSFAVAALDQAGNQSALSEVFTLNYNADEFPPAPLDFKVVLNDDGKVVLTWKNPDYEDVKGFYLMRTDMTNNEVLDFGQLPNSSNAYTDRFVKKDRVYRYMIKTYNSKWFFSIPAYQEIEIESEE